MTLLLTELLTCVTLSYLIQHTSASPESDACSLLNSSLPGKVAFPPALLSPNYRQDNAHWADSSSQDSTCSVEPGTRADVATIFNVINQTRAEWAVKGSGHTYDQGFSSTPGVLVALSRFNEISYDPNTSTARIGGGNVWDDVYATLTPQGVNVIGGRVTGVGVGGLTLGGGYGWATQQYGLTIDTVVGFELVTPTGQILNVTEQTHPDLFFGLRGGGNNFGIVTTFILKTHPQGQVYGGPIIYPGDLPAVRAAIVNFDTNNQDPKAAILASYTFTVATLECVVFLFYDGATPPSGTFDEFLNIPASLKNVQTQSFPSFIQSINLAPEPTRVAVQTVPIIRHTMPILEKIINQTIVLGALSLLPGISVFTTLSIEPFMSSVYNHSNGGAYPHTPENPWTPFQALVAYINPLADQVAKDAVQASAQIIQQVAIQEGQSSANAILYNNYAQPGTSLSLLYGNNLGTLQQLRAQYDPDDILSLTGGWRF